MNEATIESRMHNVGAPHRNAPGEAAARTAGKALLHVALFVLFAGTVQAAEEIPAKSRREGNSPASNVLNSEDRSLTVAAPSETTSSLASQTVALLNVRCASCHGHEKAEGGLRLDSRAALLKGGDRGPSLRSDEPVESLLFRSINGAAPELEMPPKQPLTKAEIALVERWLKAGAPWPDLSSPPTASNNDRIGSAWTDSRNPIVKAFGGKRLDLWSLKPVQRPNVPRLEPSNWLRNDVDKFVLSKFNAAGRSPASRTDRHTLVRRLSMDLNGLPPTPTDAALFEAGTDEADVDRLVDRFLASPRYGEHFARMWLDAVRYSDSNGFDWDEFRPQAYRFRDYVIRSFNVDKPFDRFIREQLAGDELLAGAPQTPVEQDCLIATGFLRLGPHDNAAGLFNEQDRSRHEWLTDLTETTGSAFLGLTFSCCRCHDHKYDPLSQADYYRFRACFSGVKFADDVALDLPNEEEAIQAHNHTIDTRIADLEKKRDAIDARGRDRLKNEKAEAAEVDKALTDPERKARANLQSRIDAAVKEKRHLTHALLVVDGDLQPTHILYQGNHKSVRDAVEPGIPAIFDPQPLRVTSPARASSSGRRLALAEWIASASNPLTARVFVNRVWQNLMGQGLVRTPGDFGLAGLPPDDSELLDWLASEFVNQNWSVKHLVRTIVLSATYQQAATYDDVPEGLAHVVRQPRRLTAEQLRDSMLSISGLLTSKSDGPAIWPDIPKEVLEANPAFLDDNQLKIKGWYPSAESEQTCRSIFLIQKRNTRIPLLESFDQPENSVPCSRRLTSIVAPQAISMLNGDLSVKAARAFAMRIEEGMVEQGVKAQLALAFELALQRPPMADERQACGALLEARSLTEVCRVLLNLTEFAYVD